MNKKRNLSRLRKAKKLTIVSLTVNLFFAILKVISGIVGNASVVVADGIDSFSDVVSTLVAYFGVLFAEKEADEDHQYGHEKFEAVFGKILSVVFLVLALYIIFKAIQEIKEPPSQIPTNFPLIVSIASIFAKFVLSKYSLYVSRDIDSSVFEADAKNFMNDAIASAGALIGIYFARNGYMYVQPIFSFLIAFFILKIAFTLYSNSIRELTDMAADEQTIDMIRNKVLSVEGVESIDVLRTRMHAKRIYVDIEIGIDKNKSFILAHDITEKVHSKIEEIKKIKDCMVHANPK